MRTITPSEPHMITHDRVSGINIAGSEALPFDLAV